MKKIKYSYAAYAGLVAVCMAACAEDAAVVVPGQCYMGDNGDECVNGNGGGDGGTAGETGNTGGDSGSSSGGDSGSGGDTGGSAGKDSGNAGSDSGGTAGDSGGSDSGGSDATGGSDSGGSGGSDSGSGGTDSGGSGGSDSGGSSGDSGTGGKDGGGPGAICTSTSDCSGLLSCCGGICIDPNTDIDHCGAGTNCVSSPGATCSGLTPFCQAGVCTAGCIGPYVECPDLPGVCRNSNTDKNHCGMLCIKCGASESCVGGSCVK